MYAARCRAVTSNLSGQLGARHVSMLAHPLPLIRLKRLPNRRREGRCSRRQPLAHLVADRVGAHPEQPGACCQVAEPRRHTQRELRLGPAPRPLGGLRPPNQAARVTGEPRSAAQHPHPVVQPCGARVPWCSELYVLVCRCCLGCWWLLLLSCCVADVAPLPPPKPIKPNPNPLRPVHRCADTCPSFAGLLHGSEHSKGSITARTALSAAFVATSGSTSSSLTPSSAAGESSASRSCSSAARASRRTAAARSAAAAAADAPSLSSSSSSSLEEDEDELASHA